MDWAAFQRTCRKLRSAINSYLCQLFHHPLPDTAVGQAGGKLEKSNHLLNGPSAIQWEALDELVDLLENLHQGTNPDFSPEVQAAWPNVAVLPEFPERFFGPTKSVGPQNDSLLESS